MQSDHKYYPHNILDPIQAKFDKILAIDPERDDAEKRIAALLQEDQSLTTAKNRQNKTLLLSAVEKAIDFDLSYKMHLLVNILLKHGANPSIPNDINAIPLAYALMRFDIRAPVYETMLLKLADVKISERDFQENIGIAMIAIAMKDHSGNHINIVNDNFDISMKQLDFSLQLLKEKCPVTKKEINDHITRAIMVAIEKDNQPLVKHLLEKICERRRLALIHILTIKKAMELENLEAIHDFLGNFIHPEVAKQVARTVSYLALRMNRVNILIASMVGAEFCAAHPKRIQEMRAQTYDKSFVACVVAAENRYGRAKVCKVLQQLLLNPANKMSDLSQLFNQRIQLSDEVKLETKLPDRKDDRTVDEIAADFRSRPFPLETKEIEQLKNEYSLIKLCGVSLEKMDIEKLKEELRKCKEKLKHNKNNKEAKTQALAIFREFMFRLYGIQLNTTQLFNILAMINGPDKRVAQIQTGEGKSLIIAAMTGYFAYMFDEKVDVFTATSDLAVRDAEHFEPFYKLLDLSVMHNADGKGADVPHTELQSHQASIVYGQFEDFAADYLRCERGFKSEGRTHDRAIGDEFDALINKQSLYFGYPNPASIKEFIIEVKNFMESKETDKSADKLSSYLQGKIGLQFPEADLKEWINAYNNLPYFTEDINYVVHNREIIPVNPDEGGELQRQSRYFKFTCFLELKHRLELKLDSLYEAIISPTELLKKYKKLNGLTGTLGPKPRREKIQTVLNFPPSVTQTACYDSSPHLPSKLKIDPKGHIIAEDSKAQAEALFASVREAVAAGRPVLIVCKTIAETKMRQEQLKALGLPIDLYNDTQSDMPEAIASRAGKAGSITIATSLGGRGFNIPISAEVSKKGGLKTIVTSLDLEDNDAWQKFGRGGRYGQEGSYQYILDKSEFARFKISCTGKSNASIFAELNAARAANSAKIKEKEIFVKKLESYYTLAQQLYFALPKHAKDALSEAWKPFFNRILKTTRSFSHLDPNDTNLDKARLEICKELKRFWTENPLSDLGDNFTTPLHLARSIGSADLVSMLSLYDSAPSEAPEEKEQKKPVHGIIADFDLTWTLFHTGGIALYTDPNELRQNFKEPEKLAKFLRFLKGENIAVAIASFGTEIELVDAEGKPYTPLFESGRESIKKHFQALLGKEADTIIRDIQAFNVDNGKLITKQTYTLSQAQYDRYAALVNTARQQISQLQSSPTANTPAGTQLIQEQYDRVLDELDKFPLGLTQEEKAPSLAYGKLPHSTNILQGQNPNNYLFCDDDVYNTGIAGFAGFRVMENISSLDKLRWTDKVVTMVQNKEVSKMGTFSDSGRQSTTHQADVTPSLKTSLT